MRIQLSGYQLRTEIYLLLITDSCLACSVFVLCVVQPCPQKITPCVHKLQYIGQQQGQRRAIFDRMWGHRVATVVCKIYLHLYDVSLPLRRMCL